MLDYVTSHPDAKVRFYASDMILNVHSDASYLSKSRARSRIAGYFFMGSTPVDGTPIKMNGNIFVNCGTLKFIVASVAEAELGALFVNMKEAKIIRLILAKIGHPQPKTSIHVDNSMALGITNDSVEKQQSYSMEMFFLVCQPSKIRPLQCPVATRKRKPCRLFHQAF